MQKMLYGLSNVLFSIYIHLPIICVWSILACGSEIYY
jgi:hypothetical protein